MVAKKYHYTRHFGGIVLTRLSDNASVFFQPGDDANAFDDEMDGLDSAGLDDKKYIEMFNHLCSQYDEFMKGGNKNASC